MRSIGLVLSLAAALGLAACFVQHPDLIGAAEPAEAGAWSAAWVAAPLRDGDEPGFFRVTDVDPAQGVFTVEEADADGVGMGEKMELHLRRVDAQLFLDVRDKKDGPWMLFVVEKATPEEIVLAWKPATKPFEDAIAKGDYKAHLTKTGEDVREIAMNELSVAEAKLLAANWRNLFVAERITLKRMADAN
nr:hypothetical protein [uncultured Dongia sp.]